MERFLVKDVCLSLILAFIPANQVQIVDPVPVPARSCCCFEWECPCGCAETGVCNCAKE